MNRDPDLEASLTEALSSALAEKGWTVAAMNLTSPTGHVYTYLGSKAAPHPNPWVAASVPRTRLMWDGGIHCDMDPKNDSAVGDVAQAVANRVHRIHIAQEAKKARPPYVQPKLPPRPPVNPHAKGVPKKTP